MYASQKVLGRIHTDKKIYNSTESGSIKCYEEN